MKKRTSFELYQLDSAVMVHFNIISLCPFNLRGLMFKLIIYKSSSAHVLSSPAAARPATAAGAGFATLARTHRNMFYENSHFT